ncbi:MAG: F0F1 ATP synthase subunit gamma [Acidobacteriota bacterium]
MEQQEILKRKMDSASDLQSVVKTMKALAAVNIREYQKAVESLEDYYRTVEWGLQVLMRNRQEKEGLVFFPDESRVQSVGAVIFGSEQGMVGQFNEKIASFALEKLRKIDSSENTVVMAVGERVISRLEDRGQEVSYKFPSFGSQVDLTSVAQELLIQIEEWRTSFGVDKIFLFFNKTASGTIYQPAMTQLFPLDLEWLKNLGRREWPTRMIPAIFMDWRRLFSSLLRNYFFVQIYTAAAESLASENAGRLASMQAAEKNIQDKLEELNVLYQQQRQAAITSELLDIVSGFEILSSKEKD